MRATHSFFTLTLFSLLPLLASGLPQAKAHVGQPHRGRTNHAAGVKRLDAAALVNLAAEITSGTPSPTSSATTASDASSTGTTTTSSSSPAFTSYFPLTNLTFPSVKGSKRISSSSYKQLTKLLPSILSNANGISVHSWELGAYTETLLEVYNPELTPFGWDGGLCRGDVPWNVLAIAQDTISHYDWTGAPGRVTGNDLSTYLDESTTPVPYVSKALVGGDGALGDPVSLVPAVWLLAKFARRSDVRSRLGTRAADDYAWAVGNQLHYLLNGPKDDQDTISQREDGYELWADMGYMIPPSIAYLGLDITSYTLIKEAIDQFTHESAQMLNTDVNIYNHIPNWDARLWATGNGWMTYGLMRDIASAHASGLEALVWPEINQAQTTIANVFEALFGQLDDQSLLPNYMLQSNQTLTVGDTAGTALVVAAYYRFREIAPWLASDELTDKAEQAFDGVVAKIDSDGWVTHAVDPMGTYTWTVYPDDPTMHSPEAQAFAAKMWRARTEARC
ncbi:hypothetical protein IAT38_006828 [Cryptococcus sp. DSM 104549]